MSQNNDQGRPDPSQNWYDNGAVPQSKKFPFGAGDGDDGADPETRHHPQVDDPYGQNNGGGQGYGQQPFAPRHRQAATPPQETPPYGQQSVNNGPQAPQYGNAPQQYGGSQPGGGQNGAPQYPGQQEQYRGGQGQYQQPPYQQDQPQYPAQGINGPDNQAQYNGQGQEPVSSDSGSQKFHGILDPHTGEIHPVPDLEGLQDTDALLVVVSGPDSGSQILLDTDVVTVGRSPNADIFLDDVTVSRKHAEFIRTPSGFTLRDTGSLNGTYVGRQLIDSIELQNGADVQIGKFRMIFQQRPRS